MTVLRGRIARTAGALVAAMVLVLALGRLVLSEPVNPKALSPQKQELLRREEQLRSTTQARPKPAHPERPSVEIPSDARWPSGIFDDGEFPSAEYVFVNRWTGMVGGGHVTVYAGSYAGAPSRGLVLVKTVSLDLRDVRASEYPAPPGIGALRITSKDGSRLTLRGSTSGRLTFDVVLSRFLGL
jgi:hypothetical protein